MHGNSLAYLESTNLQVSRIDQVGLRNFKGFQKSFRIPTVDDQRSRQFLAKVVCSDTQETLDTIFQLCRRELKLRRVDISVFVDEAGAGYLETDEFRYSVEYQPLDGSFEVVEKIEKVEILKDKNLLISPAFHQVFSDRFQRIGIQLQQPLNIEELIDHLEEINHERLEIDYQWQAESCHLRMDGCPAVLTIDSHEIILECSLSQSLEQLALSFLEFQQVMKSIFGINDDSSE